MRPPVRPLLSALLLALALLLPARAGARAAEPAPAEVSRLIEQLGHDDYRKRAEASRRLAGIGEPALAALRRAAAGHADAEVKARAAALVQQIEKDLRGELLVFGGGSPTGYWLNRVAFTPDGRQAVATGGAVILYDLSTGQEVSRTLELQYARCGLALTHDGRYFVTGHQHDRVVRMGEVRTDKEVRTFEGHTDGVYAVALSPDDKRLVTGSNDRTLRLWDVKTGRELRRFPGVTDMVRSADFSPDGRRVVSGHYGPGSRYLVRLWDADAGREVRSFQGHTRDVTAVLFTPDGKSIVSAGMDGAVILWDVETGQEVRRMAHTGGVYGAAVSPDGRRALTAGFGDAMVRLWDLGTGRELRRLDGHTGAVLGVAFSPDGKRALSSDSRYTLRLWRMPE
jgi:WD40 repeat protein